MAQYATNEHQQRFELPLPFAKGEDRDGENCLPAVSPGPQLGSQLDGSSRNRGRANKTAESKARRRPNLPCAWHFALYRFCQRESQLYLSSPTAQGTRLPRHPKIKEITNSTRNIKNRSFAMPADAAAIPTNPKTAATSAMIKNTTAHPNISSPPQRLNRICRIIRAPQVRCSVENSKQPNGLPQPETSLCLERRSARR